jgi:hypothetical protein
MLTSQQLHSLEAPKGKNISLYWPRSQIEEEGTCISCTKRQAKQKP